MKTEILDEPLSDNELFYLLRESFPNDESTWETVNEAQYVFRELTKRFVLKEINDQRTELLTLNQNNYAA